MHQSLLHSNTHTGVLTQKSQFQSFPGSNHSGGFLWQRGYRCVSEGDGVCVDNCVCSDTCGRPDPWSGAIATGEVSTPDSAEIGREIGTSLSNGIWDISGGPFPTTLGRNWSWWQRLCLPSSNITWNETGTDVSKIFPGSHFKPAPKFFKKTGSPMLKVRAFPRESCLSFCSLCFYSTLSAVWGLSRSRHVRGLLPNSMHFCRSQSCGTLWGNSICEENFSQPGTHCAICHFLQTSFDDLNSPLCQPIRGRVVRGWSSVLYSILPEKLLKFLTDKTSPVVCDNHLRKPKLGKQCP